MNPLYKNFTIVGWKSVHFIAIGWDSLIKGRVDYIGNYLSIYNLFYVSISLLYILLKNCNDQATLNVKDFFDNLN